jgi:hypothetical protein
MLRDAIVSQYLRLDLGAAIHYTAMVGNGAVESGRPETGLQYSDTALKAAFFVADLGFPFLAYQGKARALIALHRETEAQKVLEEGLRRARTDSNYMALAQLLIVAGRQRNLEIERKRSVTCSKPRTSVRLKAFATFLPGAALNWRMFTATPAISMERNCWHRVPLLRCETSTTDIICRSTCLC